MRFVFAGFIVLHGLVHLLYFGHSARYFELKPGMAWPAGSWAFSRLLGEPGTRKLASISQILAAVGLVLGAIGLFLLQAWRRPVVVAAAAFSAVAYLLFWDGSSKDLDGQGGIGLLIDIAILVAMLVFQWP
jgi:hypothetical protein